MTAKPVREKGQRCPLWRQDVSKVCHRCDWFRSLPFEDPETKARLLKWDCALNFAVSVAYKGTQETRGATASIDKLTNVVAASAPASEMDIDPGHAGRIPRPCNGGGA